uniref:N-acetylneuraminate (7)9-O-acetyltransferase n=1 Tax=Scleropages formosus TaxID=113540 RepID=A0A8C9RSC1_SCLFO
MAVLAYSLGKREINHYFSIKNAKLLSAVAVLLLAVLHSIARYYGGEDSCGWLLSSGRFLGENVWQPYGCMMHKYKSSEAKTCLERKRVAFMGDSRIRQLFYSYVKIINPEVREDGNKHENIHIEDKSASLNVDFLWYAEVNNSMKERFICCCKLYTSTIPFTDVALQCCIGDVTAFPQWSIKLNSGSIETLHQYKANLSSIAHLMEKLAQESEVYWVLQDPVYEEKLSDSRKMITNEQLEHYNEAAVDVLNGSKRTSTTRVKVLGAARQAALETISESPDGLHLPEGTRDVGAMVLMNAVCNKVLKPIDGSCCQPLPPPNLLQKLTACIFLVAVVVFLVIRLLGRNRHPKGKPVSDVESGAEKKPALATSVAGPKGALQAVCKMGLIMAYFYLCDRADLFMKEQKFYTHSTFFIPLIYIFVLGIFYSENSKESKLLNREQTDEWKGWMQLVILIYHISGASAFIPVYMHVRVLVAAYLFQTGYGHFSFFWLKGDFGLYRVCQVLFRLNFLVIVLCLVMDRPYQFYYFVPLVTFWFVVIYSILAIWPQIVQKKANGSGIWHLGVLVKLACLLLLICCFAYSQVTTHRDLLTLIHEWWFRWKLDRFAVIYGMLFAFVYLVLQKCQVLSEGKGEALFSNRISNCLLFVSVVSFLTYSIWASSCKNKTECNEFHPYVSVVQILAFILIRNIPGYIRSLYSSFFAWFGKISLELFICQYHIWLAADTKGILVLVPGNPMLNVIVSTFIFVCVAHEISQVTNDLAQVAIPKESPALLRRILGMAIFLGAVLLLSTQQTGH